MMAVQHTKVPVGWLTLLLLLSWSVLAERGNDVRILVDVSGSMLKSDPKNLRKPAVRMISGLIPVGAHAGMWTFASSANMQVKWGKVDEAWRNRAERGSRLIHSRGQLTNIDDALVAASNGWRKPDVDTVRSMILLTDGEVDVARDPAKSHASRRKIIAQTLPRLARLGVQIHTIALSANADAALLKKIALETGGSFEIANSAEKLQRIFLRIFERATAPDTVPLVDNAFEIDASVKEMTLLVFKTSNRPTRLTDPGGTNYTLTSKGPAVNWKSDQGFDLVTVKKPLTGQWQLDADVDPDNRVMVVTDLKLAVERLPFYLTPDQDIPLKVELHEKGKKITKNSFLKFVRFYIDHQSGQRRSELPLALKPYENVEGKGIYVQNLAAPLDEGEHRIEVIADGTTFVRAKSFSVNVKWPVAVDVTPTESAGVYRVVLQPQAEVIDPQSLRASADLKTPDGRIEAIQLTLQEGVLRGVANANGSDGLHQVLVRYEAQSRGGSPLGREMPPYPVQGAAPLDKAQSRLSAEPVGEAPPAGEGTNPWINITIVVVGNLLLIGSAIGVFIYYRRLGRNNDLELLVQTASVEQGGKDD